MGEGSDRFRCGDCILYRETDEHGQIIDVKPVTVVEDSETQIVLWLPMDTPTKNPVLLNHTPGTPRRWTEDNWTASGFDLAVGRALDRHQTRSASGNVRHMVKRSGVLGVVCEHAEQD